MSNPDKLLAAAVSLFEAGHTVVDGLPCNRSQTGQEYAEVTSCDPDGDGCSSIHDSPECAIWAWLDAVRKWKEWQECARGILYWRVRPEIISRISGSSKAYSVYSRLLISDKPVIYSGVDTDGLIPVGGRKDLRALCSGNNCPGPGLCNANLIKFRCSRIEDPAYRYRWANAGKLNATASAGWTLVYPLQERKVGTTKFGTPLYAYLYRILKEEHAARTTKAAELVIDRIAAASCSKEEAKNFRKMWSSGEDFSPPEWAED